VANRISAIGQISVKNFLKISVLVSTKWYWLVSSSNPWLAK